MNYHAEESIVSLSHCFQSGKVVEISTGGATWLNENTEAISPLILRELGVARLPRKFQEIKMSEAEALEKIAVAIQYLAASVARYCMATAIFSNASASDILIS